MKVYFNVDKRTTTESLKSLAAISVATRVTSEESLKKLEIPAILMRDLLVAHEDPWKRKEASKVLARDKSMATGEKTMVNLRYDVLARRSYRTSILAEENSQQIKNAESTKKKVLVGAESPASTSSETRDHKGRAARVQLGREGIAPSPKSTKITYQIQAVS